MKNAFAKLEGDLAGSYYAKAFFMRASTSTRCCLVIPGERPNPWMERPTRILQEGTGTSGSTLAVILEASMSEVCLKSPARPWYSQMRGSKSTAQAMALAKVKPEVAVTWSPNLAHFLAVTCLAVKERVDLISGKGAMVCAE